MRDFEKNIHIAAGRVTLSTEEKTLMRERLVSYMEHKPIRRKDSVRVPANAPSFLFFKKHHFSGAFAIALMATVSTFGVSSAADDALPGDLLYSVKVNINEEIKTVLLSSDEDVLTWEKERAEMRLMEASQLASEGRFDTESQEAVAKLFAQHTESVTEKLHAVEESDPLLAAEVSTDLEVALGTHEAVLARLIVEQEDNGGADEGARDLVEQVRTAAKEVGELREGAEQILVAQEEASESAATAMAAKEQTDSPVATEVDVTAPKENSANLRERAAYRAVATAVEEAEKARAALAALDPASELAQQAASQITSGEQLLAQGTQLLAENELGKAYGVSRRATAVFRKVSMLLEAVDLFSIEILHETVVEELPKDALSGGDFNAGTSTGDEVIEPEKNTIDYTKLRSETEDKLAQARSMLLTIDGYEEDTVTRANMLMKDAMAHVMRGEISLVLGDEINAHKLFQTGFTQAERTLELLLRGAATQEIPDTAHVDAKSENPVQAPKVFGEVTINHRFEKGTHVWSGSIETPTPCSELETGALVAESYPEQVTLELNTMEPEGVACAQVLTAHTFEIRAGASQEATVRAVLVNGLPYTHTITED